MKAELIFTSRSLSAKEKKQDRTESADVVFNTNRLVLEDDQHASRQTATLYFRSKDAYSKDEVNKLLDKKADKGEVFPGEAVTETEISLLENELADTGCSVEGENYIADFYGFSQRLNESGEFVVDAPEIVTDAIVDNEGILILKTE